MHKVEEVSLEQWQQGIQEAIQTFLVQVKTQVVDAYAILKMPIHLLLSTIQDPGFDDEIERLTQYLRQIGFKVDCSFLKDAASLKVDLQTKQFVLVFCTPAYAKKVEQDSDVRGVLEQFGHTHEKNALQPLLCEGGFEDTAFKIVGNGYLVRDYTAVTKTNVNTDQLRSLDVLIDLCFQLSGEQGLGLFPDLLGLNEKEYITAAGVYQSLLSNLIARQTELTIDYRLSVALDQTITAHTFKTYLPQQWPAIQPYQEPGFEPILMNFLSASNKAKISLFLGSTTADVQLCNLALSQALQARGIRVLSINCADYAGHASKNCIRFALQKLKLRLGPALQTQPIVIMLQSYQDLGAYDNLYVQNQLGTWPSLKVVVTCRADFFEERGYLGCFLGRSTERRIQDLEVYSVPLVATVDAQKTAAAMQPKKPTTESSQNTLLLNTLKDKAYTLERHVFLNRLKQQCIEQGHLKSNSAQNPQVFISYAWEQAGEARTRQRAYLGRLAEDLSVLGFRPWFDREQMSGNIDTQMLENIRKSQFILVVGTPTYLGRILDPKLNNAQKEYRELLRLEPNGLLQVIPLLVSGETESEALPEPLRGRLTLVDCRAWDEEVRYIERFAHPATGLITKLLPLGFSFDAFYRDTYDALQKNYSVLLAKHVIVEFNESFLVSLNMLPRLAKTLEPFALREATSLLSERFDLRNHFEHFLKSSDAKTFVTLGPAGAGKSLFAFRVFQQLLNQWVAYRESDQNRPLYVPIYVSLKNRFEDAMQQIEALFKAFPLSIEDRQKIMCLNQCSEEEKQQIEQRLMDDYSLTTLEIQAIHKALDPNETIRNALKAHYRLLDADLENLQKGLGCQQRILVICDGYDELGHVWPNLSRLLEDWPYVKVLITGRSEYFNQEHSVTESLTPLNGRLEVVYISPFVRAEIKRYIAQYEGAEHIEKQLEQLPGMMELIDNPFLLTLVLSSLPQLMQHRPEGRPINRNDIYQAFTQSWFTQETRGRALPVSDCQIFCERLAFEFLKTGISTLSSTAPFWSDFNTPIDRRLRSTAPLSENGDSYAFVHQSIGEYFAAQGLWNTYRVQPQTFGSLLEDYPQLLRSGVLDFLVEQLLIQLSPDWTTNFLIGTNLAKFLSMAGSIFLERGKYMQAKMVLVPALNIQEGHPGLEQVEVARTLGNLGNAYRFLGDVKAAKEYHERALRIQETCYGKGHIETALTLMNLGIVYQCLGNLTKAHRFFESALKIYVSNSNSTGQVASKIASVLVNLGCIYLDFERFMEAQGYFEKALEIQTNCYGEGHIETAATLTNLGIIYNHLKGSVEDPIAGYQKAKAYLEKALAIQKRYYCEEHITIANTLVNLSVAYRGLGLFRDIHAHADLEELMRSYECLEEALKIQENYYHAEHVDMSKTLANLGIVLRDIGMNLDPDRLDLAEEKLMKAQEYLKRALKIQEDHYGEGHVETYNTLLNLGGIILPRDRDSILIGMQYIQRAIQIKQVQRTQLKAQAMFNSLSDRHMEAIIAFKQFLMLEKNNTDGLTHEIIMFHYNIGNLYCKLQDYLAGYPYLDFAHQAWLQLFGPGAPFPMRAEKSLQECTIKLLELDAEAGDLEAQNMLERLGNSMREDVLGSSVEQHTSEARSHTTDVPVERTPTLLFSNANERTHLIGDETAESRSCCRRNCSIL